MSHPLQAHYDAMLARHRCDPRRGLSVIARPDAALAARFSELLE
jgi:hypothetical protein